MEGCILLYIYIYSLLFLCFSLSLVHKQKWSTKMITLFARKTSSFAMHKEVPRVWRGWFLRCQLKIWVHSSIPLRVAWGLVGAANVGSSCEEHVVMLAVLSQFHVPSFAHIFTRWHGTWWCSIFCRVKMMSHVHAPSPIFVVFDLGFPFNMTILLCAPKWMMKLFRLTEFYYQTAARLSHLMKWFMGHPGIHLRNIFQAELAHIRLKHRQCNGWMFGLFLCKRLMQCQQYSDLSTQNESPSNTNLRQPKPVAGWPLLKVCHLDEVDDMTGALVGFLSLFFGKLAVGDKTWTTAKKVRKVWIEIGWRLERHLCRRSKVEETWCFFVDHAWHSFFGPALRVPTCEATKSSFQSHVPNSRVEPNHSESSAGCHWKEAAVWPWNGAVGPGACCHREAEVHPGMPDGSPKWEEQLQHERDTEQQGPEPGWRKGCHGAEVVGHVGGAGIPQWKGVLAKSFWGFHSECHMAGGWCSQPWGTISKACPWNFNDLPHLPWTSPSSRSHALWPRGLPGLPTMPAISPMPYVS